jgi:hypothetical protein
MSMDVALCATPTKALLGLSWLATRCPLRSRELNSKQATMNIEWWKLSKRAKSVLLNRGITTVEQLKAMSADDFKKIEGLGKITQHDIEDYLSELSETEQPKQDLTQLRDHFAGLAMSIAMHQALGTITDEESASAMELVPKLAYAMADAMLKARSK